MSDEKDKKGFSGLSSLVSDVDETVGETTRRNVQPEGPPTEVVASGTSRTPTSGFSGSKWFWGLVGLGVLIWLFNVAQEDSHRSSLEFSKPSVGENNILSAAQIRWCLREDIRIEALRPVMTTNLRINQFNTVVANYNSRCSSFRYREGTLTRAQREMERVKAQIVANVQLTLDIQDMLKTLGYDPGPVDGIYGNRTKTAIEAFQKYVGIRIDGKVSPNLKNRLDAMLQTRQGSGTPQ